MSKARKDAAHKVAQTLFQTEAAVDAAIASAAQFVGVMPMARQEARLSAVVGQEAIDRAVEALTALSEARRAIVAAHNALARVQGQIGLAEVNFGSLGKPPVHSASATEAPTRLRVAA
jgi:hypothetical protein